MKNKSPYTVVKKSKLRKTFGGYDVMYKAEDHLLLVQNRAYSQSYKRFYFADIQALVSRVTKKHIFYGWFFGVLFLLNLLPLFFMEYPANIIFIIFSILFATIFIVNIYRGPTCKTTLLTRVQSYDLPIARVKNAQAIFSRWKREIEERQGSFQASEVTEPLTVSLDKVAGKKQAIDSKNKDQKYTYNGGYHLAFFTLFLLVAVLNGLELYIHNVAISLFEMVLFLIAFIALIVAIKKQHDSAMPGLLKKNTYAVLVFVFIMMGLSYFDFIFSLKDLELDPVKMQNQAHMFIQMARRDPAQFPLLNFNLIFCFISLTIISLSGLAQTLGYQKQRGKVL